LYFGNNVRRRFAAAVIYHKDLEAVPREILIGQVPETLTQGCRATIGRYDNRDQRLTYFCAHLTTNSIPVFGLQTFAALLLH
jgi:hypothetical protein